MQGQPMNKVIFIGTIHFNRTPAQSGKDPSLTASEMQSSLTLFPKKRGRSTGCHPFQEICPPSLSHSLHTTLSHQQASQMSLTWTVTSVTIEYVVSNAPNTAIRKPKIFTYYLLLIAKIQTARLWQQFLLCS